RAAILCNNSRIEPADLHLGAETTSDRLGEALDLSGTLSEATERTLRSVEKAKITEALARTSSRNDAAELLGISARTLASKMKEYGLE
ncbi:MAG: transcriptional regulator, partial [Acidobacteria bacterium]